MMSSQERRICDLLEPSLVALGYELVGAELERSESSLLLRLYIDREAGVTVDDCEQASRQVGAVLDVEDPIPESYVLEVSSPGLDRPLLTEEHFDRFAGHPVRLRTTELLDGHRSCMGRLVGCRDGNVVVREEGEERSIPIGLVEKANLVPEV